MQQAEFTKLTRKHGVKIAAGFPCTVEEIGLAVGEKVGHSSVKSAARMNSAVVIFLDRVEKVNRVIETGITVRDSFVTVLPLSQPATKVVLSNVPPFITDEFLSRELSRHGKVVSPIRKIMSGCRSPLLKHVVSHRRQLYMILNSRNEELNLRFHVKVDDYDYVIFASSSVMKCFGCGEEGHTVKACPVRAEPAPPGPGGDAGAAPAASRAAEPPGPAAEAPLVEPRAAAGPSAAFERPVPAPRAARTVVRDKAAVSVPVHTVVGGVINNEGVTVNTEGRDVNNEGGVEHNEGGAENNGGDVVNSEGGAVNNDGGVELNVEAIENSAIVQGAIVNKEGVVNEEGGAGLEEETRMEEEKEELGEHVTEQEAAGGEGRSWAEQVEEAEMGAEQVKPAQKRRRKTKNLNDAKATKIRQTENKEINSDGCESDGVSDDSDVPAFKITSSQQKKIYTAEEIKKFLKKTKNQHGVKVEEHFNDLTVFYTSARLHMSQREESGLTDQEVFRLRKITVKVRKQINDGEGKHGHVGFI